MIFESQEEFAPDRVKNFCQNKGMHLFREGLLEMYEEEII
jgi:hypothetical protein